MTLFQNSTTLWDNGLGWRISQRWTKTFWDSGEVTGKLLLIEIVRCYIVCSIDFYGCMGYMYCRNDFQLHLCSFWLVWVFSWYMEKLNKPWIVYAWNVWLLFSSACNIKNFGISKHGSPVDQCTLLRPLLLTWIDFYLSMDNKSYAQLVEVWYEWIFLIPKFTVCNVEFWEWIYNFIPRSIMDVITYPLLIH